jgi:hypothetical protein
MGIFVYGNGYRTGREIPESVEYQFTRYSNLHILLAFHIHAGHHGGFQIGGVDNQLTIFDVEKEIFENGKHRFGNYGPRYQLQMVEEFFAGYYEFHVTACFL